ncbi:hypothetical protein [Kallipyga gabonensis]|uniref:hypothetical protein n=1 Tax=Kallipyga gabonensis TaxID=1686287 RepID=UPI0006B49091|nr:hypothetical protein [Kallipyga gabonensis]
MGKNNRRKIPKPKKNDKAQSVRIGRENQTLRSEGLVFDLSFEYLFCLVNDKDFYNQCKNESHFVDSLMLLHQTISKLSGKSTKELFASQHYRHCHLIGQDKRDLVVRLIQKAARNGGHPEAVRLTDHLLGDEDIYQVGIEKGTRIIGIIGQSGIFTVLLLDFHHKLYSNETKNRLKQNHCKYTPSCPD